MTLVVPFRIGFASEVPLEFEIVDYAMVVMFFADMIVTFNTGYMDTRSETMVLNRNSIACHYLLCWFWIDMVSTIPFDSILGLFMPAQKLNSIRMIRMLRLFRLFKLSKLVKLDDRLGAFGITPSLTAIITLMAQIFFIAHLYACFWHFITLPGTNAVTPPRTWVSEFGYSDTPEYPRYIASLYYIIVTMLTVGYGDIHATNEIERLYAIVTMLT
eukprot:gene39739-49111_t